MGAKAPILLVICMGCIMLTIEDELWVKQVGKKMKNWKRFKESLMTHIGVPEQKYDYFIVPDYWVEVHYKHRKCKKQKD